MQLTLSSSSALAVTRLLRAGRDARAFSNHTDLTAPVPTGVRWSRKELGEELARFGDAAGFSPERPLSVLVPRKEDRLRMTGITNVICQSELPEGALINLGNGLCMSGPELLFVEMGRMMEPVVHLLLGMELCGRFSRDPLDPRNGDAVYDVEPITSVKRLRAFAREAHAVRGATNALATIDRIVENAWSPMEALLAALLVLPSEELGYDLWPITLNPRGAASEALENITGNAGRVPDVMFKGTKVGLNYDGEDHFKLYRIAIAAERAALEPGNAQLQHEVEAALAEARARVVDDKRRDRELAAMGYHVMPVTYEDLAESGGLDRVIALAIGAIKQEGSRKCKSARMLAHPELAHARQELIWSLMPGKQALEAHARLAKLKKRGHLDACDVIDSEIDV